MKAKRKFYVVWEGHAPGIYDSWDECRNQVEGYAGAKFKSFETQAAATEAFRGNPRDHIGILKAIASQHRRSSGASTARADIYEAPPGVIRRAIAVDGACSRNPGPMEYQGVSIGDGKRIFHFGPVDGGTNNIAEYLALVHALALLDRNGDRDTVVYSDSRTAIAWVRNRAHKSKLERTASNGLIFDLLTRADAWLQSHPEHARVIKWDTDILGEIPADFGRK